MPRSLKVTQPPSAMPMPGFHRFFRVPDFRLGDTLASGQAFRWHPEPSPEGGPVYGRTGCSPGAWTGVIHRRHLRLVERPGGIEATVAEPQAEWGWLEQYLRLDFDLTAALACFPPDVQLTRPVAALHGLRLLRQDPWECLASFILSSTKRIVQIRQIIHALCARYGDPIPALPGSGPIHAFPSPASLAQASEVELRGCKMGFRAKYLRAAAQLAASGELDLEGLRHIGAEEARARLVRVPGVGPKIADCVLLFACGYDEVFPVDVWIERGLRRLYFAKRTPPRRRVLALARSHFGPFGGLAQQYLFHYLRTAATLNPE